MQVFTTIWLMILAALCFYAAASVHKNTRVENIFWMVGISIAVAVILYDLLRLILT